MEIVITQRRPRRRLRAATTLLSVCSTLLGIAFILPSLFGLQRFVITGTSMTGTIDYGSIAFEEVVPVATCGSATSSPTSLRPGPTWTTTWSRTGSWPSTGTRSGPRATLSRSATRGSSGSTTPSSRG